MDNCWGGTLNPKRGKSKDLRDRLLWGSLQCAVSYLGVEERGTPVLLKFTVYMGFIGVLFGGYEGVI